MKYYIQECDEKRLRYNAGSKARKDADRIFAMSGAEPLTMVIPYEEKRERAGVIRGLYYHLAAGKAWKKALAGTKAGDTVLFQFPVKAHTIRLAAVLKKLKRTGVRTIALIHDLEYIRNALHEDNSKSAGWRLEREEKTALKEFDRVIAHNERMKKQLAEKMEVEEKRIVTLEIFDYLIPGYTPKEERRDRKTVIIAGNLKKEKSGYIYRLPENVRFNLYGAGWQGEETENIRYHGKYLPDELPGKLEGGYGLVWDGPAATTCSGVYGQYLKFNNPHKTSLYLAAGIPVIIWEKAAMADFIRKEGCGITVASLDELKETMEGIDEKTHRAMLEAAGRIGTRLREGYYTRMALEKCMDETPDSKESGSAG